MEVFDKIGIASADILLPRKDIDLLKWSVIACDQYTSEPEYWDSVEEVVGDNPSSLHVVLPESYLGTTKEKERLRDISTTIDTYLQNGIWEENKSSFILIDRKTLEHDSRKGLVLAVDLEAYSFEPGNTCKIRATEGTVLERIPPRVTIRSNAKVELPHIMLLIDDKEGTVIENAFESISKEMSPTYDTDLMLDSGHLKGYLVNNSSPVYSQIITSLEKLYSESSNGILFLVGDGNHSLASAKKHWENIKASLTPEETYSHRARYALCEITNIHDKGLEFEPIHRIIFDITREDFITKAEEFFKNDGFMLDNKGKHVFTLVSDKGDITFSLHSPSFEIPVQSISPFLDSLKKEIDYIHGEDSVRKLATSNNIGLLLPDISKDSFFDTIAKIGVYPRKTFSMGHASEKRFYMEAKRI